MTTVTITPTTRESIIASMEREVNRLAHEAEGASKQANELEDEARSLRANAEQLHQSAAAIREVISELAEKP